MIYLIVSGMIVILSSVWRKESQSTLLTRRVLWDHGFTTMVIVSDYTVTYNEERNIFCWKQCHILLSHLRWTAFLQRYLWAGHAAGRTGTPYLYHPLAQMPSLRQSPQGTTVWYPISNIQGVFLLCVIPVTYECVIPVSYVCLTHKKRELGKPHYDLSNPRKINII